MIEGWLGAYQCLADHDLTEVSGTSRLLHDADVASLSARIGDELRELGGVLRGEHQHIDLAADIVLEGSQVLYWLVLALIRSGRSTSRIADLFVEPHLAEVFELSSEVEALSHEVEQASPSIDAKASRVVAAVARAAQTVGLELSDIISRDLADLRSRPYLAGYFATVKV